MSDLQRALSEKRVEVDQMLDLIADIQRPDPAIANAITKAAMLRSALVLLLYNIIEGTAFLVFERVHERVAAEHYEKLGPAMQKIWAEFFFTHHGPPHHHVHLEGTIRQTLKFPLIEEFGKRAKLFSGNLDGKKLNELLKRYGIAAITAQGRSQLVIIKDRRNAIAHGDDMFKEACRHLSDSDLRALKDSTFEALDELIRNAEAFIVGKHYLAPAAQVQLLID